MRLNGGRFKRKVKARLATLGLDGANVLARQGIG